MKFSFNWIQDLVSGKLPLPEKSTEIDDIQNKIIKRLEENLNWEVRK